MTTRSTIVSAIVFGLIFCGLWLLSSKGPSLREQALRREALFPLEPAEAERIEISAGGENTVLEKDQGVWKMTAPLEDLADPSAVRQLLEAAADLSSVETLQVGKGAGSGRLADFGLSSAKVSLAVLARGRRQEIWFGKETAIEGRIYVRVAGTNFIDVVPANLQELVLAGPDAFRNKFLFQMEPESVAALRWRSAKGNVEVVRDGTRWRIQKPESARADTGRVFTLLHNLTRAKLVEFLPQSQGAAPLPPRDGEIIELEDSNGRKSTLVGIGFQGGKLIGRLGERGADVALPEMIRDVLAIIPRDLRERSLLRFDPDFVDRIRIERGGETLTLERDGEAWTGHPGAFAADPEKAEVLLRMLGAVGLAEFVADTRASAGETGLEPPSATIRLLSFLSEDSLHAQAGEHPIATVQLGGATPGGRIYAATDNDPFVFSIPVELAEFASTNPSEWRSRAVLFGMADDVAWIEPGSRKWRIERNNQGAWVIKRGKGPLDQAVAESLAATLARLRAVEWLDAPPPEAAGAPSFSLIFGWDSPDNEKEQTLTLDLWIESAGSIGKLSCEQRFFTLSKPMTDLLARTPLSD